MKNKYANQCATIICIVYQMNKDPINITITTTDHCLPDKKFILPCSYGLRCYHGLNCPYWHNKKLKIIPLCKYGQKCTHKGKTCFLSHDIIDDKTVVCEYGLYCYAKDCTKVHPIEANQAVIGKYNLLHRVVQCTAGLNPNLFNITVFDSSKIPLADLKQVVKIDYLIDVTVDRYTFISNHIYQLFSNKVLGGGSLTHGNVQEEKMMMNLSILQYLLYGFHCEKTSPLSNNLQLNPIVIDTMVVVKDNSYSGCKSNMDSPHYGQNGLKIAHDKTIADSIYDPIDMPLPVKAMAVAVPPFKNWSGKCYNNSVIMNVFQSLYKAFVTSIAANESNKSAPECQIHIGNIGCGVFGHNYHTIFVLQYLAAGCAINLINPGKKICIKYHAYDEKTYNNLLHVAVPALIEWSSLNKPIEIILADLRQKQISMPDTWAKKL